MAGVAIGEQAFNVLLRFVVDKKTLKDIESGTTSLQEALVGMEGAGQVLALSAYRLQPVLDAQIKKTAELQNAWWKTQRVIRASAYVFTTIAAAGTAMFAPILLAANNFAKEAEKAGGNLDPVAAKWLKLQDSVKKSTLSIGRTSAEVLLPTFEKVAQIVDKASKFIESNPKLLEAALKVGAAVVTLGTLGLLVTNGIKMVVDIQFVIASANNLLAGKMMESAAKKNLLAALAAQRAGNYDLAQDIVLGTNAISKPLAGGIMEMVATVVASPLFAAAVTVLALSIGGKIGTGVGNMAARKIYGEDYKDQKLGNAIQTAYRIFTIIPQSLEVMLNRMGIIPDRLASFVGRFIKSTDQFIAKLFHLTDATKEAADALPTGLAGSAHEKEIVDAFIAMREKDKEAELKYADDMLKINTDLRDKETKLAKDFEHDVAKIASNLSSKLANLSAAKRTGDDEALRKLGEDRAKIIKDTNKEIIKIQQDAKDEALKLEREHNDRVNDLIDKRDALGLVKENRKYAADQADAKSATNKEIIRRRQETTERLQELNVQYAQEKAKRQAEYLQKVAEAKAEAAAATAERQQQYREQQAEARAEANQKLKDLKTEFDAERIRRRDAFIAQVRDLDAALLGDQRLRQRYYQAMLADAAAFLQQYRASLPSAGGIQAKGSVSKPYAEGGYASGLIRTGEKGPEFVLSHETTRAAEMALNGRLSQRAFQSLLLSGSRSITLNDHRRFDSRISKQDRNMLMRDQLNVLNSVLGGS